MVCYEGNCVNGSSVITKNLTDPCSPNPCKNGGQCVTDNIVSSCICSPNFTGKKSKSKLLKAKILFSFLGIICESSITTTNPKTTSTTRKSSTRTTRN